MGTSASDGARFLAHESGKETATSASKTARQGRIHQR